jgi:hypothetical protein
MKNNEVVKDNKEAKDEMYDVHVSSPWFKMKIDDISWKTIIIVGMILGAIVYIIKG